MLENDIEMVVNAVARSAPSSKLWDAMTRIKKALSGSGQNSAELIDTITGVIGVIEDGFPKLAVIKLNNLINSLPSGETNNERFEISAIFSDLSWFESDVSDKKRFSKLIERGRKLSTVS